MFNSAVKERSSIGPHQVPSRCSTSERSSQEEAVRSPWRLGPSRTASPQARTRLGDRSQSAVARSASLRSEAAWPSVISRPTGGRASSPSRTRPSHLSEGSDHATRGARSRCVRSALSLRYRLPDDSRRRLRLVVRTYLPRFGVRSLLGIEPDSIGSGGLRRTRVRHLAAVRDRDRSWRSAERDSRPSTRRRRRLRRLRPSRSARRQLRSLRSPLRRRNRRDAVHRAVCRPLRSDGPDRRLPVLHDASSSRLPGRQPADDRSLSDRTGRATTPRMRPLEPVSPCGVETRLKATRPCSGSGTRPRVVS